MKLAKGFLGGAGLFLVITLNVFSATGVLQGTVTAKGAGNPLPEVRVGVPSLQMETGSAGDGGYRLEGVPAGRYMVTFRLQGFRTATRSEVVILPGRQTVLNVELEKSASDSEESVNVTGNIGKIPEGTISQFSLGQGALTHLAGSIEDIGRMLNFFPAIAHVNELSNDLIVRGGSPFENGYYIDNIPIYNISHFQREGASGGIIGIINPDLVSETNFFVGAFPARYGDRLSAIMDLRFREGMKDRTHFKFDLNAAGFSVSTEGPLFRQKGAFILSLRRSYLDILAAAFSDHIAPRYGDWHLKLDWAPDAKDQFTFLSIVGDSSIAVDLEEAVIAGYNSYLDSHTYELTAGINWHRAWSARLASSTSFSVSRLKNRDTLNKVEADSLYEARNEQATQFSLRHVSRWQITPRHSLEFGFDLQHEYSDFYNYFAPYLDRWGDDFPGLTLEGDSSTLKGGLFLSLNWNPLRKLTVVIGNRLEYFSFNRNFFFSPRLNVSYALSATFSLRVASGIYYQQLYPLLLARNPLARDMRTPRADHFVIGAEFHPDESTQLTLEVYDKECSNYPLTPDDPFTFVIDNGVALTGFLRFNRIVDSGLANARGIEFFLHKTFGERIYVLAAASVFRSRYRDLTGVWRNRINDNRLVVTLAIGYDLDNGWKFSTRWNYAGGLPYTPCDVVRSAELNFGISDLTRIMAARYPPYHSLYLRVDRRFIFKRSSLTGYFTLVNAYARGNVARYYWSSLKKKVDTLYQPPLLPIIGLQYDF